jgi:hypothetical protein
MPAPKTIAEVRANKVLIKHNLPRPEFRTRVHRCARVKSSAPIVGGFCTFTVRVELPYEAPLLGHLQRSHLLRELLELFLQPNKFCSGNPVQSGNDRTDGYYGGTGKD